MRSARVSCSIARLIAFLFAGLTSILPTTAIASDQSWKGSVKLWSAELDSPIPKPLGIEWAADVLVKDEPTPGFHVVARSTFVKAPWTVVLLVTRTNPTNGVPSYLAVQTTLKHDSYGLVAQCSRYDALGTFSFLPPGACSGQMAGKLVGVSLLSPYATVGF